MKFDVFFVLKGAGGIVEAPNKPNPIEAPSLNEVLRQLVDRLPENEQIGLECIGVRIVQHEI